MDLKGGFITIIGGVFVFLGGINAATKDGVPGLIRLADLLEKYFGNSFFIEILKIGGKDYSTLLLITIGFLFLIYRGPGVFRFFRKYLPIKAK